MIDVKNGEWQMIELTIVRLTFETFDMVWAEPPNICEDIDIITYLNFFEHVWLPVHNLKWFISGCKATVWGFSYLKNMPYSYDVEWCYQFSDSVCRLDIFDQFLQCIYLKRVVVHHVWLSGRLLRNFGRAQLFAVNTSISVQGGREGWLSEVILSHLSQQKVRP